MLANPAAIIEQFDCNASNPGPRWTLWKARLEQLFIASDVASTAGAKRLNTLFLLGGNELYSIHQTLPKEVPTPNDDLVLSDYDKAILRLDAYFNPKRNIVVERFTFRETRQNEGETIAQFVTRLKILATYCEFDKQDDEIVLQVIQKCASTKLRRVFLKERAIDLKKLLELGKIHDTLDHQIETVEGRAPANHEVNAIKKSAKHSKQSKKDDKKCIKCGRAYPHAKDKPCPAINQQCRNCDETGHFASVCKKDSKKVNSIDQASAGSSEIDEKAYIFSIGHHVSIPTAVINVYGTGIDFKIDTGAAVNIIDEVGFRMLKPTPRLLKDVTPTFGYSSSEPLPTLGRFTADASYKNRNVLAEFYVMRGNHGRLLSCKTSQDLSSF
jgi:hypothetical protein